MTTTPNRIEAANAHLAASRFDQALALFDQVLKKHPEAVRAYIGIGRVHLRRGDYQEATRYFVGAAHVAQNPARALMLQAAAVEAQGDTEQALELSQQALKHDPDLLRARLMAARFALRLEQFETAEAQLRETLRLHPGSEMALSRLIQLYQRQHRPLEELQALVEPILAQVPDADTQEDFTTDSVAPNHPEPLRRRALLLLRLRQYAAADALLAQYLVTAPTDTTALTARARALLSLGNPNLAIKLLETARKLDAGRMQIRVQLARAYLANTEYEAARALLTELAAENQQLPVVHFLLAELFSELRLYRQSVQEYQAGLLHAPQLEEEYPALAEVGRMAVADVDKAAAYRAALAQVEEVSLVIL